MRIKRYLAVAVTATAILGTAATASAAQNSPTPAQKTCSAFVLWNRSHTTAHLDTMVTASFSAPYKYVGEDAIGLYKDVRSKAAAKYITADIKYFKEDCA